MKSLLDEYLIVRPCWMFGGGPERDKKFVAKIVAQFGTPEIRAISDSFGSPTFGKDLAHALGILIEKNERGIIHLSGKGNASRYDVAKIIIDTLKPEIKVTPVTSDYFNLPAARVQNEILSSRLSLMRPWQEALVEYLETEWRPFIDKKPR